MEQHLIVAIKAIIPLFLLIGVGIYIRWQKMLTDTELQHVNSMIFRIFFFCMMFYNMYTTTLATALRPRLIIFTVVSLFVMLLISAVVVCTVEKDNRSRGAMLQALFRSNFVLLAGAVPQQFCAAGHPPGGKHFWLGSPCGTHDDDRVHFPDL